MATLTQSYQISATHCLEGRREGRNQDLVNTEVFEVQLNHPGLGPTHPFVAREQRFVTAAVMDTGQPQPETRRKQ